MNTELWTAAGEADSADFYIDEEAPRGNSGTASPHSEQNRYIGAMLFRLGDQL